MKLSLSSLAQPVSYFSSVSIPRQILGASSTHIFCNRQGQIILGNDGYKQTAQLFSRFSNDLNKGVIWADRLWRSMTHHYNPETNRGVWPIASSAQKCKAYFRKALILWREGKQAKAMFFLGAAVHLIQDACVPHHALCQMFDGHLKYEKWAKERVNNYKVNSSGLYHHGNAPEEWVSANARVARGFYNHVNSFGNDELYHQATSTLLVLAQRSTAGFFHFSLKKFLSK